MSEAAACKEQLQQEIQKNYKKNALLSITDGSVFAFGMGMVPLGSVLIYYIGHFVESKTLLGLLTTMHGLLFFAPQVLMSRRIDSIRLYKPLSVTIGLLIRAVWLLMGVSTFLFAKSYPALYVVVFYLSVAMLGLLSGLNNNAWLNFMARVIPPGKLSDFFSVRASIGGILEICGAVASGIILSFLPFPYNYGNLFFIVFIILMISLGIFNQIIEPDGFEKKTGDQKLAEYFKRLKQIVKGDKNFQVYLISTALVGGLGKMSLAFQIIYAKEKLGITIQDVAVNSTVSFITQTIGYIVWGIVVKKKGLKLAGTLSGFLFIPSIILTLWMPNVWILHLAAVFLSLAQSYRNSNENKLMINLAPTEEDRASYIGLRNTLMSPFFSLNSMVAGVILDVSSFTILTIISLILMAVGTLLFALKLKAPELDA